MKDDQKERIEDNLLFIKKVIEVQSEHSRWSTALTLLISIAVASLIALLGSFLELQNSNFFSETKQDTEKITIEGGDSTYLITPYFAQLKLNSKDSKEDFTLHSDTIRISKFKVIVNSIEKERASNKLSATQIFFSCTTLLSLIFTLFIYIIRRNVEQVTEKINIDEEYKYKFAMDLIDDICNNEPQNERKKEVIDKLSKKLSK